MKKVLSIILVLLLVFTLFAAAGCGDKKEEEKKTDTNKDSETNTELTVEDLKASKPGEYIQEKLAAGMEVLIGIDPLNLADEIIQIFYYGVEEMLEADGYTVVVQDSEGDAVKQLASIDNFREMDCSLIYFAVYEVDAYKDIVELCHEEGILIGIADATPDYYVDGILYVDGRELGEKVVEMAIMWIDEHYGDVEDGSIHACVMQHTSGIEMRKRTDAMMELLPEDPRIEITFTNDLVMTVDEGFTAAEEALTYDPDIRLFCTFSSDSAIGVANYIESQPNFTIADFGVFTTGATPDACSRIDAAGKDESASCLRGTIGQGGVEPDPMYVAIYKTITGILNGEFRDNYVFNEHAYAYTYLDFEYDNWA